MPQSSHTKTEYKITKLLNFSFISVIITYTQLHLPALIGCVFFTCVDFCKDKEAGNHADPDNCYGFIMCDVAGNAHEMDCPTGLAFNPSLLVCDWPENVECEAGSGELS